MKNNDLFRTIYILCYAVYCLVLFYAVQKFGFNQYTILILLALTISLSLPNIIKKHFNEKSELFKIIDTLCYTAYCFLLFCATQKFGFNKHTILILMALTFSLSLPDIFKHLKLSLIKKKRSNNSKPENS